VSLTFQQQLADLGTHRPVVDAEGQLSWHVFALRGFLPQMIDFLPNSIGKADLHEKNFGNLSAA
jgi:hypothetical protein